MNSVEVKDKDTIRSKKDMILSLFRSGITQIETIAAISNAKPSYVGSVLQNNGLINNYYDLYTSTAFPMNVYTKHFRGKLGFKDEKTADRGVRNLEVSYAYFERIKDRAGQHHALEMGLTMLDRARWTGKLKEAEIYRRWLVGKLSTPLIENAGPRALDAPKAEEKTDEAQFKIAA